MLPKNVSISQLIHSPRLTHVGHDIYRDEINDELQQFYDHYCKGIDNGWKDTPRFRLSLLGFNGSPAKTIVERPEETWPIPRTKEVKYYLDSTQKKLSTSPLQDEASASYEAHSLTDTVVSNDVQFHLEFQPLTCPGFHLQV